MTDLDGNGPYLYKADHIHFHGAAEHLIDGVQHDIEMHIVHVIQDGDRGFENYHEKVAIIAVLFQIAEQSHPVLDQMHIEDRDTIA